MIHLLYTYNAISSRELSLENWDLTGTWQLKVEGVLAIPHSTIIHKYTLNWTFRDNQVKLHSAVFHFTL